MSDAARRVPQALLTNYVVTGMIPTAPPGVALWSKAAMFISVQMDSRHALSRFRSLPHYMSFGSMISVVLQGATGRGWSTGPVLEPAQQASKVMDHHLQRARRKPAIIVMTALMYISPVMDIPT